MKKLILFIFLFIPFLCFSQKIGNSTYEIYLCKTSESLAKDVQLKFLDNLSFEERVRFGRLLSSKEPLYINNGYIISKEEFSSIFEEEQIYSIEFIENAFSTFCSPREVTYLVLSE